MSNTHDLTPSLAIPQPGEISNFDFRAHGESVIAWLDDQDDIEVLVEAWEQLRPWDAYLKELGRTGKDTTPMLAAVRYAEVRIGEELPAPHPGRELSRAIRLVRPTSRTEFRRFARHREDVTTELYAAVDKSAPGRASRRHLIRYLDEQYGTEADQERDPIITDQWEMRHGDFTQELATLPDESVDLIVTDPPYPKKDLPLYGQLAETAARVLKPRGILFTYAGNIFLPEVQQLLGQHLNYGWTFCLLMGQGSDSRIMGRHLRQKWKPVLAYTPHQWPSGEWGDDLLLSGPTEKDLYGWQQTTGPAERLIEHYSPLNGLILDPFAGAASFGVAALTMGRRFVGVELDADRYDLACRRLEIESPIST